MAGRSNEYYLPRLERDHPAIYTRYAKGELSARAALIEAGIKQPERPINELRRQWTKASPHERELFLGELADRGELKHPALVVGVGAPTRKHPVIDPDGLLSKKAVEVIRLHMGGRGITRATLMDEMGLSRYDYRLAGVLERRTKVPVAMEAAIRKLLIGLIAARKPL